MTPHRTLSTAGYTVANLKSLTALQADVGAAGVTLIAAAVGWAFGPANAELIIVLCGAMLLDLIVGASRAVADPLNEFSWKALSGGLAGKLFRFLFIVFASLVDKAIMATGMPLPDTYDEMYPVVKLACLALIYAELLSSLNHFRAGGVAPGAIAVVMRHMDRLQLGYEPPEKRDYDAAARIEEAKREAGKEAGD